MLYLARILTDEECATPASPPDSEKKGWLQVIYKGEIRWARPCFSWGMFTPPDKLWLQKYANKFAVWVSTTASDEVLEREDHLIYVGFEPYEEVLGTDIDAAFPEMKWMFSSRWDMILDEQSSSPRLCLRYRGDQNNDTNAHPDEGTEVLSISQKDGSEEIALTWYAPGTNKTSTITIDKSHIEVKYNDKTAFAISDSGMYFGSESADEPMVLGNQWKIFATAFLEIFMQHIHPTGVGPSGPPATAAAAGVLKTKVAANTELSNFIFGQKIKPI